MEKDWRFHHIAILTKDMDKAVEYYESCGIGPFEPEFTINTTPDYRLYGKIPDPPCKAKVRMFKADPIPIMLEFLEPTEGESLHTEFLAKHGEGVEHIAFFVDDVDKEIAKLEEKGYPVVYCSKRPDGSTGMAYFDTRKFGNLFLELMQAPKE